jgi:hypothetical protein
LTCLKCDFRMYQSNSDLESGAAMSDSKDKRLDEQNNERNKELDGDRAQNAGGSNETLIAGVPAVRPDPVPGGRPNLEVLQGGKGVNPAPNGSPKPAPAIGDQMDPMDREKLNRAREAADRVPEARPGAGEALENAIKKSDPITPATPVKPISTPTTTPTPAEIPKLPDPFAPGKLWGKPTPAKEEKQTPTPGRTNTPPKQNPGVKKEAPTKAKPFDNGQFHTNTPGKWTEGTPGEMWPDYDTPAKKKTPTKRTPADRTRERRQKQKTNETTAGKGKTSNTPPATTPTPARNPSAPAPTPGTRTSKKEAVEKEVHELTKDGRKLNINRLPTGLKGRLKEGGYSIGIGVNNSVSYRGPGTSNLHVNSTGHSRGTLEYGPSPTNKRISNSARAEKNILEGTGVKKIPDGYQNHHITPDAVWQKARLLVQYDKNSQASGRGKTRVDDKGNLTIMPESKGATKNQSRGVKKDVKTLYDKELLLKNINHDGSHSEWSKYAAEVYKNEVEKLRDKFGRKSLDKIDPSEVEKSVKRVQEALYKKLKEIDQKIEKGDFNDLPDWVQPHKGKPGEYRLSEQPKDQQTNLTSSTSISSRWQPSVVFARQWLTKL